MTPKLYMIRDRGGFWSEVSGDIEYTLNGHIYTRPSDVIRFINRAAMNARYDKAMRHAGKMDSDRSWGEWLVKQREILNKPLMEFIPPDLEVVEIEIVPGNPRYATDFVNEGMRAAIRPDAGQPGLPQSPPPGSG